MPRVCMRWYAAPLLLSVNPLVIVIGANAGREPLDAAIVLRSLLVVLATTFAIVWALRFLQRDLPARATWAAWFLILVNVYGASLALLRRFDLIVWEDDPAFATIFVVTCGVIAAIVSRPWEARRRTAGTLLAIAALFFGVAIAPSAFAQARRQPGWRAPADTLLAAAIAEAPPAPPEDLHDIFYIVLDGMGSAATLRSLYNVDLQPFVERLEERGFFVAAQARSNYTQTYLSLASTLNLRYLDALAAAMGPDTGNRNPLRYLVQKNALMEFASRAGYRVVVIGSGWEATQEFDRTDVCHCSRSGPTEFELAAIGQTPLAAVPAAWWSRDAYDAHRGAIVDAFTTLEEYVPSPEPEFVFAHVMAPHPPFVLGKDGTPRRPDRPYTLESWRRFGGSRQEYVDGYAGETWFVMQRTVAAVEALLARPGPPPVIVIHGDHGPGVLTRWDGQSDASVRERMAVFAAYHFPGARHALYPTITPVNGARLLAKHYFEAEIEPLPDRVLFSTGERPYDLSPVP